MKYDAVIFDLDGTLWDSREGIAASWGETLRTRYGADKVPTLDDITGIMGLTVNDIADRLLADYGAGVSYPAGDATAFRRTVGAWRVCVRTPAWERLRDGARRLAAAFDAHEVYGGYVAWVEGLCAKRV